MRQPTFTEKKFIRYCVGDNAFWRNANDKTHSGCNVGLGPALTTKIYSKTLDNRQILGMNKNGEGEGKVLIGNLLVN